MAFTQRRAIELINAATDYQEGIYKILRLIHEQCQYVRTQSMSPDEALNFIELSANIDILLTNRGKSESTISIERRHFATNQKRNNRKAQYMASKRLVEGVQPRRKRTDEQTFIELEEIEPEEVSEEITTDAEERLQRLWEEHRRKQALNEEI